MLRDDDCVNNANVRKKNPLITVKRKLISGSSIPLLHKTVCYIKIQLDKKIKRMAVKCIVRYTQFRRLRWLITDFEHFV